MSEVIVFEDQNFEKLIRKELNIFDRPITIEDAKKVRNLSVNGRMHEIKSVGGIEYFTELENLSIDGVKLEKGISTLKNSIKLRNLTLKICGLENTSGIENFNELRIVDLSYNHIECAQELENITTLEEIYISNNKIKNIEFCKKLKDLKGINFDWNKVNSLDGLEENKQITWLSGLQNEIINIDAIENSESLDTLNLSYNKNIENFSPLGTLKNIKELYLEGCNLSGLKFLKSIKTLSSLRINDNNLNNELELDCIVRNNPIERLDYRNNPLEKRLKSKEVSVPNKETKLTLMARLCILFTNSITENDIRYRTEFLIFNESELDMIKYFKNLKKLTITNIENFKSNVSSNFDKFKNIKEVTIRDSGWDYNVDEYMEVEQAIDRIVNEINKDWTELEKARYIYERLGQTITYDDYFKWGLSSNKLQERTYKTRNLYGPLVEGRAVCVGYSNAYSRICNRVGIKCECVSGDVPGIENSKHEWNMINIDGEWFHCDLTWDEDRVKQGAELKYFCKSEKTIEKDHRIREVSEECKSNISKEDISNELIKAAERKLGIRSCNDRINQLERNKFNDGFDMINRMKENTIEHTKANEKKDEIRVDK